MTTEVPAPAGRTQSRLVARLLAEMQINALARSSAAVQRIAGNAFVFDRAIFFLAVLRASGGFLGAWAGCGRPQNDSGISVNAISQSMQRPFETTRRQVNALIADGLCTRTDTGVVVAPGLLDHDEMIALLAHLNDCLVWLVLQLRAFDVPLPRTASTTDHRADITLAASIDLALSAFENAGHYYTDWLELAVVNTVMAASARDVTFDPDLARLYSEAHTVPPAGQRRTITAACVARALGIPYSTVRRQIIAAIQAGWLVERDHGVIVPDSVLAGPAVALAGTTAVIRSAALLGRLVGGGFPFDDPATAYRVGPPAMIAFD